jgi:hypothetical protein
MNTTTTTTTTTAAVCTRSIRIGALQEKAGESSRLVCVHTP